jgi:hypothetical protein
MIIKIHFGGKTFLIGHGDGKDLATKDTNGWKVFTNPFFKWLLDGYPDIGVRLAQYLSVKNKLISGDEDVTFLGKTTNGWFCILNENSKPSITITSYLAIVIYQWKRRRKFRICKSRRLDYFTLMVFLMEKILKSKNTRTSSFTHH